MTNDTIRTDTNMDQISPATDIVETGNGFYMFMDLPGVNKEGLNIELEEHSLIVTGRITKTIEENEILLKQEFGDGEYSRTFTIADVVDRERIKATLKNGVLELFLPKKGETKTRKIKVSYDD